MIAPCPICSSKTVERIFQVEAAPIFQLLQADEPMTEDAFAPLRIVRCLECHHLYNQAYRPAVAHDMYSGMVLSNVPVHASMAQSLERIAAWIGPEQYAGKRVLEVGAGSGYLARVLARLARAVIIFEPCRGLQPNMLPEPNITLVSAPFAADAVEQPADLIICRQVLEHVADPRELLKRMRSALADDGRVYVEVPRAEYIEEHAAVFDLHCAHVQYFHESNLLRLITQVGLEPIRHWYLKEGHDIGLLLKPIGKRTQRVQHLPAPAMSKHLQERLERRLAQGRALLSRLQGATALYGATWPGLSFLNYFQLDRRFVIAFDDNPDYDGCVLYSRTHRLPVHRPSAERVQSLKTIIITAYLHEPAIVETLQQLEFSGEVIRIEPEWVEFSIARDAQKASSQFRALHAPAS